MPDRFLRTVAVVLALPWACAASAPAAPEEALFRQLKVDVFDQDWPAVLRGCEEILRQFPRGAAMAQAAFYRATALSHLPGRQAEAPAAYRRFLVDYPDEKVLVEEAWSDLFRLACDARGRAGGECVTLLREGLGSRSPNVVTQAAIRASDVPDAGVRRRALPLLKRAYDRETDPEIRDEVLIAILKIDPKEVPQPAAPRGAPGAPVEGARPGGKKAPTLIRMTVYDKKAGRYDLKINLPIAFARMLLDAVDEEQRQELRQEAEKKGIDLDHIFQAIEKAGAGKLLEAEDDEGRVEIWIE